MLLETNDQNIIKDLSALCINLAINEKNAEAMIQNHSLKNLIVKAFREQNALLMKIFRNISQHDSTKEYFLVS